MPYFLQRQCLVIDKPTGTGETAHLALLFSVHYQFEFVGLQSLHGLLILCQYNSIIDWSMEIESDLRHGRHCVFKMHVHLVFVTKYRRNVFTKEVLDDLKIFFEKVCLDFESELVEMDGEDDHVHLLVNYPPKVSVSALVNSLKGVSSRMIRKKNYPSIKKKLWGGALWSPSYFAGSCGGAPIEIIHSYLESVK